MATEHDRSHPRRPRQCAAAKSLCVDFDRDATHLMATLMAVES